MNRQFHGIKSRSSSLRESFSFFSGCRAYLSPPYRVERHSSSRAGLSVPRKYLKGIGDAIYKRESLNLVIIYSICLVLSYVGKSGLFVRSYLHAVCPSRRLIMCSAVSFTLLSPTMSKNIPSSVESIRVSSMNNLYPIRRRSNLLSANYTLPWLASIHHVFPRRCLQESDSLCIAIAVEQMA